MKKLEYLSPIMLVQEESDPDIPYKPSQGPGGDFPPVNKSLSTGKIVDFGDFD